MSQPRTCIVCHRLFKGGKKTLRCPGCKKIRQKEYNQNSNRQRKKRKWSWKKQRSDPGITCEGDSNPAIKVLKMMLAQAEIEKGLKEHGQDWVECPVEKK